MKIAVKKLVENAKKASYELAGSSTEVRNQALLFAKELLLENESSILKANEEDLKSETALSLSKAARDRLLLNPSRIFSMANALEEIASLYDPIGEIVKGWVRPNGLVVSRVRVPIGVIGVIYENRPNVTSDAFGLCIKSANAVILRGSSSAINSNKEIVSLLRQALEKAGLSPDCVCLIEDVSRESVIELLKLKGLLDCVIPRGGPDLVNTVLENASVPVIVDGDGNCHAFVDETADINMAISIVVNAKTQRPGVCNALETLLVHKNVAEVFLVELAKKMPEVEIFGDETVTKILPNAKAATEQDWKGEYLDLKLAVGVVSDIDAAIEHVRRYSSGHSEAIITESYEAAKKWVKEVDSSCVLVNASTRFVDGGQLGLGAEIGISTQKLHARGPMGLEALTTLKLVVEGKGQVRN